MYVAYVTHQNKRKFVFLWNPYEDIMIYMYQEIPVITPDYDLHQWFWPCQYLERLIKWSSMLTMSRWPNSLVITSPSGAYQMMWWAPNDVLIIRWSNDYNKISGEHHIIWYSPLILLWSPDDLIILISVSHRSCGQHQIICQSQETSIALNVVGITYFVLFCYRVLYCNKLSMVELRISS